MLDIRRGELIVSDRGSKNGIVVGSRLVRNGFFCVGRCAYVLFGDAMLWIVPGARFERGFANHDSPGHDSGKEPHGVLLLDVCDSTDLPYRALLQGLAGTRRSLIGRDQDHLLLLKPTGDGYLAIFDSPTRAARSAERLLRWRKQERGLGLGIDIRVTVDAGRTIRVSGMTDWGSQSTVLHASKRLSVPTSIVLGPGAQTCCLGIAVSLAMQPGKCCPFASGSGAHSSAAGD